MLRNVTKAKVNRLEAARQIYSELSPEVIAEQGITVQGIYDLWNSLQAAIDRDRIEWETANGYC